MARAFTPHVKRASAVTTPLRSRQVSFEKAFFVAHRKKACHRSRAAFRHECKGNVIFGSEALVQTRDFAAEGIVQSILEDSI
jgi:hypothetical protein